MHNHNVWQRSEKNEEKILIQIDNEITFYVEFD